MKNLLLILMTIALPLVFTSCSDEKDEPDSPNQEYVDLGLPSGTMWATCNVGAKNPEDYGDYFAWGETTPKDEYVWQNYKWAHWEYDTISEYYYNLVDQTWYKYYDRYWSKNGYVEGDGKMELDPEDDAAYVNMGSNWRMPTLEQLQELRAKCNWLWTQRSGVKGYQVTGPNGKSIFLPASGGYSSNHYNDGECAYYWSRTRSSSDKLNLEAADHGEAYILFFNSWGKQQVWYDSRYVGITVRPVRVARK